MKIFVLFGSTGDLASRYVLPALGSLLQKGEYDHLVCVGRRDWSRDDFQGFLAPFPELVKRLENISYVKLDLEKGDFGILKEEINLIQSTKYSPRGRSVVAGKVQNKGIIHDSQQGTMNDERSTSEITYHLCLSPEFFVPVARGLASAGLNDPHAIIMIEKPFGFDLATAMQLNLELQTYFSESQIYRVDHYLGKNFVQEFVQYRLSQGENWYRERIEKIEIKAYEALTVDERGEYYDKSGVTRDVFQNHLLQELAIIIMHMPIENFDDAMRDRIFQAISSISPLLVDPTRDIILGQYRGYRETPGVQQDSQTPTFIHAHLVIDDPRWHGVNVQIESGKALGKKESSVTIIMKDGTKKVFEETSDNKNNAYEFLISKAFARDVRYFVRWDSVRAAWQVVDALLHCTDNCPVLRVYTPGKLPEFLS